MEELDKKNDETLLTKTEMESCGSPPTLVITEDAIFEQLSNAERELTDATSARLHQGPVIRAMNP